MDQFFVQPLGRGEDPHTSFEAGGMVRKNQPTPDTPIRLEGGAWLPAMQHPDLFSNRDWIVALLLAFFVGGIGLDRFYLGYTSLGMLKLLTCGGFGIWAIIDLIWIALDKLPDAYGQPLRR